MARKTVKELNIDFVELEEKVKAFEIVAKVLEKFDILDVVRKLEKIDIIEAKLDKLNEKNNLKEKEANNAEDVALVSTQSFECRKCTTRKHLKQHITKYHAVRIECQFCEDAFEDNSSF